MYRRRATGTLAMLIGLLIAVPAAAQVSYEVRWSQAQEAPVPQPLEAPLPRPTTISLKARIQGVVIVQMDLTPGGAVADLKLLKGLPMGLDEAALDVLQDWSFPPGEEGRRVTVIVEFRVDPAPKPAEIDTPEGARAWLDRMAGLVATEDRYCASVGHVLWTLPEWFSPHPANLSAFYDFATREDSPASWLARLHLAKVEGQDPQGFLTGEILEAMSNEEVPRCLWCLGVQDALRAEVPPEPEIQADLLEAVQADLETDPFFTGKEVGKVTWNAGGEQHADVTVQIDGSRQDWYLSRSQGRWQAVCRDALKAVTVTTVCHFGPSQEEEPPQGQLLTPPID
jgi:TonB family protein